MDFGKINTQDCVTAVAPPPPNVNDGDCSDPTWALANPQFCPDKLVIKPGVALVCILGSVQTKAFLSHNTTPQKETDVTADTIFTTSNPEVAVVGSRSGNVTGLAAGEVTITASYQGRTSFLDLTVIAGSNCCAGETTAMMLVIDTSKSMSLPFDNHYPTRLDYAGYAAHKLVTGLNEHDGKDSIGLMRFNAFENSIVAPLATTKAAAIAGFALVSQTQYLTSFHDALVVAIAALNENGADRKILALFSDGEDSSTDYTDTNNPVTVMEDFKAAGGIVICLGVRASGSGYRLLNRFATGGFFINAYNATASDSLGLLVGLKGYLCAGNCVPDGDVILPVGELDFSDFANWNVANHVDLLGNGFMDLLPGNGVYVDLAGSVADYNGKLTTKVPVSLVAGKQYRASISLAGNQRQTGQTNSVRLVVFSLHPDLTEYIHLQQVIALTDAGQDFRDYSFMFQVAADVDCYISVEQLTAGSTRQYGALLGSVTLDSVTDVATVFADSFEGDNLTYIPPRCGLGTTYVFPAYNGFEGYATGYNCYGEGCLDQPPAAQRDDPNPLPDVESGDVSPQTYSSTRMACKTCPAGTVAVSLAGLIPAMTSATSPSGSVSASEELTGYEAWHAFANPTVNLPLVPPATTPWKPLHGAGMWIQFDFTTAKTVSDYEITIGLDALKTPWAWEFQASNDNFTTHDVLDSHNGISWYSYQTKRYRISTPASYKNYRLKITTVNSMDDTVAIQQLSFFESPSLYACKTATAISANSQAEADSKAQAAAELLVASAIACRPVFTVTETSSLTCDFPGINNGPAVVTRSSTKTSLNDAMEAQTEAAFAAYNAAYAALDCSGSNNDQAIKIRGLPPLNTISPGDPYPSVKYVSGMTGLITNVKVRIAKISFDPTGGTVTPGTLKISFLLVSPTGQACVVLLNAGFLSSNSNYCLSIEFDDSYAVYPNPALAVTPCGDWSHYCPTHIQPVVNFPSPAPGPGLGYDQHLSAFIGHSPNGAWALMAVAETSENMALPTPVICASWDLIITTA